MNGRDWYFLIVGIVGGIGACMVYDALFVSANMTVVEGGAIYVGLYWGFQYYSDYFFPIFEKTYRSLKS